MRFVSVVAKDGTPLMPCKPAKARRLLRGGGAIKRWNRWGKFYIQLTVETARHTQPMVLAEDPGSKFDGVVVATKHHIQTTAMLEMPDYTSDRKEMQRRMRRFRRYRKCRRRPSRFNNRSRQGWLSPTQVARLGFRIVIIDQLCPLYPVTDFAVEDVRFNHYAKRWGKHFSTVEVGKSKLYSHLEKCGALFKFDGWQTREKRQTLRLKKSSDKNKIAPESHATDAIALASLVYGRVTDLSISEFWVLKRPSLRRRSLHLLQPARGGTRRVHGGTVALGIRKNTVVWWRGTKTLSAGIYRTGGSICERLSLHEMSLANKRVTQKARIEDLIPLYHQTILVKQII